MDQLIIPEELKNAARRVLEENQSVTISVRELLSWFLARRRGVYINGTIRQYLQHMGLSTDPDFEYVYIGAPIKIIPLDKIRVEVNNKDFIPDPIPTETNKEIVTFISGAIEDPTFRIGQLKSANILPVSVGPNATLAEATTLMMLNDYSQLPVMQNERTVKGVISWESIGKQITLNRPCITVRDCLEPTIPEVSYDSSLLSSIELISKFNYVLVRKSDNVISGIVTTSDVALQFRQLAEPFLLIGEIENYIRRLIDGKFTPEELSSVKEPGDDRPITKVSDLAFGQYVRLLENPKYWANLKTPIDRTIFIKYLDKVRELRNDVMHFDPDPFAEEDIRTLRSFANFIRSF